LAGCTHPWDPGNGGEKIRPASASGRRNEEAGGPAAGAVPHLVPHPVPRLIAAYHRRDYRQAAERFEEAEGPHPHWKHQRWQGKSLSQVGKLVQAEALLLPLADPHRVCPADVAWSFERPGDTARAVELLERRHGHFPDDRHALARLHRLEALEPSTGEIQEEIALSEELERRRTPPHGRPTSRLYEQRHRGTDGSSVASASCALSWTKARTDSPINRSCPACT
jgi:hypothetical protein